MITTSSSAALRIRSSLALLASSAVLASIAAAQTPKPPAPSAPPASSTPAATPTGGQRIAIEPADPKWLDRLPKDDRAALDELLGWAPPAFTSDLEWLSSGLGSAAAGSGGGGASGGSPTWDNLRGKVVVLQSFTTATTAGRGWPQRVAGNLKDYPASDVRIIALHTPDGAAEAKAFLAKKPAPEGVMLAIDPTGAFCDALAIYKQPVNIIIDRNGAVRYAGLNNNGLEEAVKALTGEKFNANLAVPQRGEAEAAAASAADDVNVEFPPFAGKVDNALDIRGKSAPEFYVEKWMTPRPNAEGKVVVLDFWATWCGPCVASIPHMNELATKFKNDVVCVGISSEAPPRFEEGMERLGKEKKITLNTFQYAIALDPGQRMQKAVQITGIPHCMVLDRNWIVRWQGHPASLDAATVDKIVKADAAQGGKTGGNGKLPGSGKKKRWTTAG